MIGQLLALLTYMIVGLGFSAMIFWVGATNVKERISCKEKKQAKFLGIKTVPAVLYRYRYIAVFEVEIHGKKREHGAIENLGVLKKRRFKVGQTYTIYSNPQNPYIFRCTKKIIPIRKFILYGWAAY